MGKPVVVRKVWSSNLDFEFGLLRNIIHNYPVISMDTEFPGIIVRGPLRHYVDIHNCRANYFIMKANIDIMNLIQIGLTLSDAHGNLPDLGTKNCYVWEFNFREFDVSRDFHSSDSIELLRRQGIDFEKNSKFGIDSAKFSELLISSGLVCNNMVTWVTFHGAYDFGYMLKLLTRNFLPDELPKFLQLLCLFFGPGFYDVKHVAKFCNLYGGLEKIAKSLGVNRVVGKSHQSGPDSLLTLHVFQKMREVYFLNYWPSNNASVLYGLEN